MMRISNFFLFFIFAIAGQAQNVDNNIFSRENTRKYAEHLFNSGNYSLAIPEYTRLTYLNDSSTGDQIHLIRCFRYTQNYSGALEYLEKKYSGIDIMPQPLVKEYLNCKILNEDYSSVPGLLSDRILNGPDKSLYLGVSLSMMSQLDQAEMVLNPVADINQSCQSLVNSIKSYRNSRRKSPALAMAMSSVVPGSGKFYTGDWKDGLFALSYVGLTAWQSYRGFNKNGVKSVYGWLFGIVSVSLYIGNIYGSAKSANTYNLLSRENFQKDVQNIFLNYIN